MAAMTPKERTRKFRAAQKAKGLVRREIWLPETREVEILFYVEKVTHQEEQKQ